MIIFPAIDLKGGKCVRLFQGRMDQDKVYSDVPEDMARRWVDEGGAFLHVVDLEAAVSGKTENRKAIENIVKAVSVPVQVGGGMRDRGAIDAMLSLGVARVIIGTAAIRNPEMVGDVIEEFGREKIVAGIDALRGVVKISGWSHYTSLDFVTLAKRMELFGVERVVFTDIEKDGALQGPNIDSTRKLAEATNLKVIASGGVTTTDDVRRVKELGETGVEGMIIGKALYEGTIQLKDIV
jgi:phosphoribosylformimino-5-aminoimidazole carboxamide ribotide isomerase